jgi:hypothetical protein
MGSDERARLLREAVRAIASRCPRLIAECYWAGTSAIALEELGHRESFDLDFHSRHAFVDTRPFLGTDNAIRDDLLAYPGVDPADAISMRDELLRLLKTEGGPR